MNAPRLIGGAVALVLSAAVGVIPAVGGDEVEQTAAHGADPTPTAPGDSAVPEVPADAGPVIRDAVASGGATAPGSGSGVGSDTVSSPGAPPAPPAGSSSPSPAPPAPPVSETDGDPTVPSPGPTGPARVTGLSFLFDLLEFGSEIGPHEVTGLLVSALGTVIPTGDLPPELVNHAYTILSVPDEVFTSLAEPTMQGFAALRASIEPLAATNEGANMLIKALSDAMIAAGTEGASLTNPLDAQVVQIGKFLIVLQEEA